MISALSRAKKLISICTLLLLAAACVSPEQAQRNREARLANQFPDPADRVGMYIMFQSNETFIVQYFPSEVSRDVVLSRMDQWCVNAGLGSVAVTAEEPNFRSFNATLAGGETREVRSFQVNCNS
ncbi:hypothetical protein QTO30_18500 [Yoonia sp. GPGPB17]|uniref:hypothetical protein n=1 Tax=Yoonia sp. GPGPB17 TaxID=3026147 RepID=UPI0030BB550C